jgi:DnaJ-domain-containing protein 1
MHSWPKETRLRDRPDLHIFIAMSLNRPTADYAKRSAAPQCCAWTGCAHAGEYRAPKDRSLTNYVMLCLEHVRTYNAQWNFHAGLSTAEMELEIRSAATWDRPTWKLGSQTATFRSGRVHVHDPFGFAEGTAFDPKGKERRQDKADAAQPGAPTTAARAKALKVFELTAPITMETLRRRYKVLVKQHHPDANGGSAEAETRMKVINEAYQTLRASLAV